MHNLIQSSHSGTAPSPELLATWNKREQGLIDEHPGAVPAVAFPPEPKGVHVGQDLPKEVLEKIAREGARTVPGREHGGNCDVSLFRLSFLCILTDLLYTLDQKSFEV